MNHVCDLVVISDSEQPTSKRKTGDASELLNELISIIHSDGHSDPQGDCVYKYLCSSEGFSILLSLVSLRLAHPVSMDMVKSLSQCLLQIVKFLSDKPQHPHDTPDAPFSFPSWSFLPISSSSFSPTQTELLLSAFDCLPETHMKEVFTSAEDAVSSHLALIIHNMYHKSGLFQEDSEWAIPQLLAEILISGTHFKYPCAGITCIQRLIVRFLHQSLFHVVGMAVIKSIIRTLIYTFQRTNTALIVRLEIADVLSQAIKHPKCAEWFSSDDGYTSFLVCFDLMEAKCEVTEMKYFTKSLCALSLNSNVFDERDFKGFDVLIQCLRAATLDSTRTQLVYAMRTLLTPPYWSLQSSYLKDLTQPILQSTSPTNVVAPPQSIISPIPTRPKQVIFTSFGSTPVPTEAKSSLNAGAPLQKSPLSYSLVASLDFLPSLLHSYHTLPLDARQSLSMIIVSLIIQGALSVKELRLYCELLHGSRATSTLIVATHLSWAVGHKALDFNSLREVGLLNILHDAIALPDELPYTVHIEQDELRLLSSLIPETKTSNTSQVLGHVLNSLLRLTLKIVKECPASHSFFRDSFSLKLFSTLLHGPPMRETVLKIVAVLGSNTKSDIHSRIVRDLLAFLQSFGGTIESEEEERETRLRVLSTLGLIFSKNKASSGVFRSCGGFPWLISILDGLSRSLTSSIAATKPIERSTHTFLAVVLETLGSTIKNNKEMQDSFREDFLIFTSPLRGCCIFSLATHTPHQICDLIINLATYGVWPSCHSVTADIKSCRDCFNSLIFMHPNVITLAIAELMPLAFHGEPNLNLMCDFLEKVLTILDAVPENLYLLNTNGLHHAIIKYFGDSLRLHAITCAPFFTLLVKIFVRVGMVDMSPEVLHKFVTIFTRPGFPTFLLTAFTNLMSKSPSPTYAVNFGISAMEVLQGKLSLERLWPPRHLSFSLWFRLGAATKAGPPLYLMSIESTNKYATVEMSVSNGALEFCARSSSAALPTGELCARFSSHGFAEHQWYHIVVHLETPPAKRGSVGKCQLFVDSVFVSEIEIQTPPQQSSKLSVYFSKSCTTNTSNAMPAFSNWQLGPCYCFDTELKEQDIFFLYHFGPDFSSNFLMDVSELYTREMLSKNSVGRISLLPSSGDTHLLAHLQQYIIFSFIPRKVEISVYLSPMEFESHFPVQPIQSAKGDKNEIPTISLRLCESEVMIQKPKSSHADYALIMCRNPRDVLNCIGGVRIILYIIGLCNSQTDFAQALLLLDTFLCHNPLALRELDHLGGYELIKYFLVEKSIVPDMEIFKSILRLVGFPMEEPYGGVIQDINAFSHLLLKWKLLDSTQVIQSALWDILYSLISDKDSAVSQHNLSCMNQIGILKITLNFYSKPSFVPKKIIRFIKLLIHDPPLLSPDLSDLANFLIINHSRQEPTPVKAKPLRRAQSSMDMYSLSEAQADCTLGWSGSYETNITIIEILIDLLSKYPGLISCLTKEETVTIGPQKTPPILPVEFLLEMLNTRNIEYRLAVLKLLSIYLCDKYTSERFESIGGYTLLGALLCAYPISSAMIDVLLKIMSGGLTSTAHQRSTTSNSPPPGRHSASVYYKTLTPQFIPPLGRKASTQPLQQSSTPPLGGLTTAFSASTPAMAPLSREIPKSGLLTESLAIARPGVITTILMLTCRSEISFEYQEYIVKNLYITFLRSEILLCDCNVISGLLDLFFSRLKRRASPLHTSGDPEIVSGPPVDEDKLEVTITAILRSITLHACHSGEGIRVITDLLAQIYSIPNAPAHIIGSLQRRILWDVLVFFKENDFTTNKAMLNVFGQLTQLILSHVTLLSIKSGPSNTMQTEADALIDTSPMRVATPTRSPTPTSMLSASTPSLGHKVMLELTLFTPSEERLLQASFDLMLDTYERLRDLSVKCELTRQYPPNISQSNLLSAVSFARLGAFRLLVAILEHEQGDTTSLSLHVLKQILRDVHQTSLPNSAASDNAEKVTGNETSLPTTAAATSNAPTTQPVSGYRSSFFSAFKIWAPSPISVPQTPPLPPPVPSAPSPTPPECRSPSPQRLTPVINVILQDDNSFSPLIFRLLVCLSRICNTDSELQPKILQLWQFASGSQSKFSAHTIPLSTEQLKETFPEEYRLLEEPNESLQEVQVQISKQIELSKHQRSLKFGSNIKSARSRLADMVVNLQWDRQKRPQLEKEQEELLAQGRRGRKWRKIWSSLTHECGVFYWNMEHFMINSLVPTSGPLHQRIQIKKKLDLSTPRISPPFLAHTLSEEHRRATHDLNFPSHHPTDGPRFNQLPFIHKVDPNKQSGCTGGTLITLSGKRFKNTPDTKIFIGGRAAEIQEFVNEERVVVRAPDQDNFGCYEVVASYQGEANSLCIKTYAYIDQETLESYTAVKNLVKYTGNRLEPITGHNVIEVFKCSRIRPYSSHEGQLLVGEKVLCFHQGEKGNCTWSYEDIREIHQPRYLLKHCALEIFLIDGKTFFFAFDSQDVRDWVLAMLKERKMPNLVDYEAETQLEGGLMGMSITKKWQNGLMSNFEYLVHINTLAGRTVNDLNQYPVFPFVIADYTSPTLDLKNPLTFRDLSKPMGAQTEERRAHFMSKYESLKEIGTPYLYCQHYSNSAIVHNFLVRLQPFTSYHLDFQKGNFDCPDRLFFSMENTWSLASTSVVGDVKELIPEFYYFPDFLLNSCFLDLGVRQVGERVMHVELPPWARGKPREFIRLNRRALESEYVSDHLHEWIDLIFGFKQQSLEALNVFHPHTVEGGFPLDNITDPELYRARVSELCNWGQIPRQIFKRPHPRRKVDVVKRIIESSILSCRPSALIREPFVSFDQVNSIVIQETDAKKSIIPQGPRKAFVWPELSTQCVSWGYWDLSIRLLQQNTSKVLSLGTSYDHDETLCGVSTVNGRFFISGGTACVLKVWEKVELGGTFDFAIRPNRLFGHVAPIITVFVSHQYSIIVSGSSDGMCIVWNLNKMQFAHCMKHTKPVTHIVVSPSTGEIYTVEQSIADDNSRTASTLLNHWTINGGFIGKCKTERINSIAVTSCSEGLPFLSDHKCSNYVVTGHQNGVICLWSAITLHAVGTLKTSNKEPRLPVVALAVSSDSTCLFSADAGGEVLLWAAPLPKGKIENALLGL